MVQSVELTLDGGSAAAVRRQWQVLADAGLPSQARHPGPSNAPHVTLAALPAIDDSACGATLQAVCSGAVPLPIRLGALTVFGRDPYVLVRLVVVTAALLDLHRQVSRIVGTPAGTHLSPGSWTPHVTLARRLAGADLPAALAALPPDELTATAVAVRRWDGEGKRVWLVSGAPDR